MMQGIIEKSSDFLSKKINCDSDTYEKIKYGVSIVVLNLYKTILLIIISLLLGIFKFSLVFLIAYTLLRAFAAGIHLKNDYLCTAIGLLSMIWLVYLSIYIDLNIYIYFALYILSFIAYYLYAPAATKKRPIAKKRIKPLKIKSLITVLLFFLISFIVGNGVWRSLITYSVVLEAINILPLTYKLTERG